MSLLKYDEERTTRILSALSILTDAMAAMDTMIAEAEKRGLDQALEKAARHAETFLTYLRAGEASVSDDLGAAIRAMKGGAQ